MNESFNLEGYVQGSSSLSLNEEVNNLGSLESRAGNGYVIVAVWKFKMNGPILCRPHLRSDFAFERHLSMCNDRAGYICNYRSNFRSLRGNRNGTLTESNCSQYDPHPRIHRSESNNS